MDHAALNLKSADVGRVPPDVPLKAERRSFFGEVARPKFIDG